MLMFPRNAPANEGNMSLVTLNSDPGSDGMGIRVHTRRLYGVERRAPEVDVKVISNEGCNAWRMVRDAQ